MCSFIARHVSRVMREWCIATMRLLLLSSKRNAKISVTNVVSRAGISFFTTRVIDLYLWTQVRMNIFLHNKSYRRHGKLFSCLFRSGFIFIPLAIMLRLHKIWTLCEIMSTCFTRDKFGRN